MIRVRAGGCIVNARAGCLLVRIIVSQTPTKGEVKIQFLVEWVVNADDDNDDADGDCFSDDVEPSADVQRVIPSGGFSKVERKTSNDIFAGSQKLVWK